MNPLEMMEIMFVNQFLEKAKSANFECLFGQENIPFDEPTTFGLDFVPKGTIKFLFITGVSYN